MKYNKRREAPHGIVIQTVVWKNADPPYRLQFAFYSLLLFIGIIGACGCFSTAFTLPVGAGDPGVLFCCAASSLFFAAVFCLPRFRTAIALGFTALYALTVWLLWNDFVQGFLRVTNRMMEVFSQNSSYSFDTYVVKNASVAEERFQYRCFFILALLFVAFLLSLALVIQKSYFLSFLITLPCLAVPAAVTVTPSWPFIILLLLFWCLLAFTRFMLPKERRREENGRSLRQGNYGALKKGVLPSACGITVLLLVLLSAVPPQTYRRPPQLDQLRTDIIAKGSEWFQGSLSSGGPYISTETERVNLRACGNQTITGATALKVTDSQQRAQYLRGFVGGAYENSSWELLDDSVYDRFRSIPLSVNVQNFVSYYAQKFPQDVAPDLMERIFSSPSDLIIEDVGNHSSKMYTPYGLISGPGDLPDARFMDDGAVMWHRAQSNKSYRLHAYGFSYDAFHDNPPVDYQYASLEELSKIYHNESFERYQQLKWGVTDLPQGQTEYASFVYEQYTQLPAELQETLWQFLLEHGIDPSIRQDYVLSEEIEQIAQLVRNSGQYTLEPGNTPGNRDFIEYFLLENQRGYCVHFASAGVALLRSVGIPARYVSGFVITKENFNGSETASIPDSQAHAWVEYYLPSIGWIPLEVTPGSDPDAGQIAPNQNPPTSSSSDSMSSSSTSSSPSSHPLQSSSSTAASNTPSPSSGTQSMLPPEGTNGFTGALRKVLPVVLLVFGFAAALVLLFTQRRAYIIRKRANNLKQKDTNAAAIEAYVYLEQVARFAGKIFPAWRKIPRELYELAQKAKFSDHTLTGEEVSVIASAALELAEQVWNNRTKLPLWQRFYFRYGKALW